MCFSTFYTIKGVPYAMRYTADVLELYCEGKSWDLTSTSDSDNSKRADWLN
jgi:hypothetical protein